MQSEKSKMLLAEIAKTKKEMFVLKEEIKNKIKDNFHGMAMELFASYPELKSFGWRQYTPYFNDGEACTFRSNHDTPIINGNDSDYGDNEKIDGVIDIVSDAKERFSDSSTNWKDVPNPNFKPYYKEIVETVIEFLSQFDDDDMYDLFDDHSKVIITAEGCTTEDFDHD